MSDIVGKAGGSLMSAVYSSLFAVWTRKDDDRRARRRGAAADLLEWIPELRELLVGLESRCDKDRWEGTMRAAFASLRRVREVTPGGSNHLRQSIFDCIGNGAGAVVCIDSEPSLAEECPTFDRRWTENAAEYIEYLHSRVQAWRDEYATRNAAKVQLLSYNDWLLRLERLA